LRPSRPAFFFSRSQELHPFDVDGGRVIEQPVEAGGGPDPVEV